LAHDPALRGRVRVEPVGRRQTTDGSRQSVVGSSAKTIPMGTTAGTTDYRQPSAVSKIASAEVLESLHRATGMPIVSDFYTRLFKPEAVSVRSQTLYDTLNQLGDAMRMRWHKEGGWLQFRSVTFFDDRRKEVPNRLLSRWSEARREHGALSL